MAVGNLLIQALIVHLAAAITTWPASTSISAGSAPTTTCSTSSYTSQAPYYSSLDGPSYGGAPYSWVQYIFPTTVGTVYVTVEGTKTESRTVYNTELPNNGTFSLLTRTDTNSAGTVTTTVGSVTVTYPHNYTSFNPSLTWYASIATVIDNTYTCCTFNSTMSPTPTSHIPFPTPPGSTNPADPNGSYYSLQGNVDEDDYGSAFATSLFGQSLTLSYTGCHYSACGTPSPSSLSPANQESAQVGFVLATTSITLSSSASASSSSASSESTSSTSSSPTSPVSSSSPPTSSSSESSSVPPLSSTTAAGTTSPVSTSSSPSSPQSSSTLSTTPGNGSPPSSASQSSQAGGQPPSSASQSTQIGGQPPSSASQPSQGVGSPPSSASQSQVSPPNSSSLQQTVPAGSTSMAGSPPSSALTGPETTAQNTPGMASATPTTSSPYAYTAGATRLMPVFCIRGWLQWIVRFFN